MAISGAGVVNAALIADHTLKAWGYNADGAVGNGITSTVGQWTPTPVSQTSGLTNVQAIATGWDHMVALAADGTVWTWGANGDGQLGNGTKGVNTYSSVPIQVSGLISITGVSAGDGSTVVLKSDGTVWAWGSNGKGECGNGTVGGNTDTPVRVLFPDFLPLSLFLPIIQR